METTTNSTWIHERVGDLPLIAQMLDVALSRYRQTKTDYPTLGQAIVQVEEGIVTIANKAYPSYQTYIQDKVEFANKTACETLDYLEKNYPQIKITPEELAEMGQRYYEHSVLKDAADTLLATKAQAVDLAIHTKQKGVQALDGAKEVVVTGTNVGVGSAVVGAQLSLAVTLAAANLGMDAFRFSQQTGVDALQIVNRSEKVVREALLSALISGKATAQQVVSLASAALSRPRERLADGANNFLDLVDALVDRYIADGGATHSALVPQPNDTTSSIPIRMNKIGNKVAVGLSSRAQSQVFTPLKASIRKASDELNRALVILDYVREKQQWAKEQATESYTRVTDTVLHTYKAIEDQALELKEKPETVLLRTIKGSSGALSTAAFELQKRVDDLVPEPYRSQVQAAVAYVHQLDQAFSEAGNLYDVRDEIVSEAKERLGVVEHQLVSAVDKLVDLPPISWMTTKKTRSSSAPTAALTNGQDRPDSH